MANQADKKREKSNAAFTRVISYIFIFVMLWFFVVKYLFKRSTPVTTGAWIGYTIQLLIQTACFKWISMSMETHIWNEAIEGYAFDIYAISVLVSILFPFNGKWFYLYLIILFAFIFIIGQKIVNWVFTPTAEELQAEIDDPKLLKKQRKAELRQRRQMNMRH